MELALVLIVRMGAGPMGKLALTLEQVLAEPVVLQLAPEPVRGRVLALHAEQELEEEKGSPT